MRVVLDTNVIISALFWKGPPRRVVDLAADGTMQALTSLELLAELEEVLTEDFAVPKEKLDLMLKDVLSYSEVIASPEEPDIVIRDRMDLKVIACAISGRADCIITGDRDLLILGEVQGIRILTPRALLESGLW